MYRYTPLAKGLFLLGGFLALAITCSSLVLLGALAERSKWEKLYPYDGISGKIYHSEGAGLI